jgi:D-3-phosphoglycerate dehydrogenase
MADSSLGLPPRQRNINIVTVDFQHTEGEPHKIQTEVFFQRSPKHLRLDAKNFHVEIANAPPQLFGRELAGKTLGLVGAGDIALRAARIMKAGFRVNVVGYSPSLTPEKADALGIGHCATLDDVLRKSDIVNLGVHLLPTTENLISDREFDLMKPDAILINTSRGGVLDEAALYRAITTGRIAGAACDVFEMEPPLPLEHALLHCPNTIVTPHIAFASVESMEMRADIVFENLYSWLEGKQLNAV